MLPILQDPTPNRKTTQNHETPKLSPLQQNWYLYKTFPCVISETDYPPTDYPKLLKHNNIQNTRKSTFPSPPSALHPLGS